MTSLEINIFSPSESENLKSLLKNPDEDFQKIVSLMERKIEENNNQYREIDENYRYFIENSLEGVWVIDEDANTVLVNASMAKLLGYTNDEMIGKSLFTFMDEKTADLTRFHLEKRKKGISEERDALFIHKSGNNVYLRLRATPIFNDEGNYKGTYAFLTDITEHMKAEQKLKESEEKFKTITEQSLMGICIAQDNKIKYINQIYADIFGYSIEEMMKWNLKDVVRAIYPEDRTYILNQLDKKQQGEKDIPEHYQYRGIKKSGEIIWVENFSKSFKYGGRPADLVTLIDITERTKAEQKLKESEEQFRTIAEQSFMGIIIMQDGVFKYYNEQARNLNGYSDEEIQNWEPYEFSKVIHPDDKDFVIEQARKKQSGDPDVVTHYQYRLIKKDGDIRWVENFSKTINYKGKTADFVMTIDITDKIEAENKIRESEERYRNLFENSPNAIALIDLTGKIIDCNLPTEKIFGYSVEDLVGQNYLELPFYSKSTINKLMERFQVIIKGIEIEPQELDVEKKDGSIAWIKTAISYFKIGEQNFFQAIIQDITEQKKAEQQLRESEDKFRTITEQSVVGIAILQDNQIKYVNQRILDYFGYTKEEVEEWPPGYFINVIHPDSREIAIEIARINQSGESKSPINKELKTVKKNGKIQWTEFYTRSMIFNGKPAGMNISIDITERKKAEQKLKESEEKFRNIAEQSFMGIIIIQDGLFKYFNDRISEMNGYSTEEMKEWGPYEFLKAIYPEDREFVREQARKKQIGDPDVTHQYRYRTIMKNGEIRWTQIFSKTITYEGRFADLAMVIDITDKIEAENKIKESEEQFRTLTEQSFLGIAIIQNNLVKYVNKQLADIFRYPIEEIINWGEGGFLNVIYPEDRQIVAEQARKKQLGESDVLNQYEFRGIKKNGEMIWLELFSKSINYRGELADFVTIHDITDKKISQQRLKESEEKFRKITEESLLAICIIQDDTIKYINQEMANLYGYSTEEMLNWGPRELLKTIAEESLDTVREQLIKKQTGDPDVIIHYPIQCIKKNGDLFWVDNLSKTMMYEGRPADLITQIDITERIKAQQELVKLNQLKSELLRRTSHELKTPLVSIKGFSELLLEVHRDKLDALVISTINEIKQGCLRLESLIGDILKTAELESGTIELYKSKEDLTFLVNLCVNEIKGFSRLRNHTIKVEIHDTLITQFEKEQIHQVISNLLNNAVKYTPPSGLIEIKSEITDKFIILSIKDNGIGFTEEEKVRIFTQFGKIERYGQGLDIIAEGSGFGLYISKKIIELHGGDIWVESGGRNKGSTFYFSLPLI
ncbi:MAG: PAS domain S-box protein [Promethearchaeota archaeon]